MKLALAVAVAVLSAGSVLAAGHSDDDIHWSISMTVNDGMADNVVPLVTRMAEATMDNEPDAMIYEYMQAGDQVHIYERYADNAAAVLHMSNFGENFAEEFFTTFTVDSISIYGPAQDDLKAVFEGTPVVYLDKISGFAR